MNKILDTIKQPGVIAGVLTVAATVAAFANKPALAAFFQDPATADAIILSISSVGTLVSGLLRGISPSRSAS